ncbi:hypothetical protein D5E69_14340 [Rossellomorea marisflavi]|uniref:hypothetical protein n=1 Tax=Rossellomorea marisflavi TaxID=189381 RepID=UPI001315E49C|nr:hypothetical protein [Rossellomorea marisflavi]QHA36878.1 hypothetical protein D5E69_14340 [Rossellomorea marisflavi]
MLALIAIARTVYHILGALTKYEYGYLPIPSDILKYFNNNYKYFKKQGFGDQDSMIKAQEEVDKHLCSIYIEVTDKLVEENERKIDKIRLATKGLTTSLCIVVLLLCCFIPSFYQQEDDVQNIRIIENDSHYLNFRI